MKGRGDIGPAGWMRDAWAWLAALLLVAFARRARAEAGVQYRFEDYAEDARRTRVLTHAAEVEAPLGPEHVLRGQFVADAISGATPTGAPPPAPGAAVPVQTLTDLRLGETLEWSWHRGAHTLSPRLVHSDENDYESWAPGVGYSLDLNSKNSTLNLGLARDFDAVQPRSWRVARRKDEWEMLAGWVQVVNRYALLTVNLTVGTASGYLSDPYKGVRFDGYPSPRALFPDTRPGHRTRQVAWVGWNQAVPPLHGAAEASYRFSHDSFGVAGHTATLEWFQEIGPHFRLAPLFRYHRQSAARFYGVRFPGDPTDPEADPAVTIPSFYSADYRLSELETYTMGISASWRVHRKLSLDAGYKRYRMQGLDGVTARGNYPAANIWTLGFHLQF